MDILSDTRPINEVAIRKHRVKRLQELLASHDVAGILAFDPINLRYMNGSRNMQVWTMHNFMRYGFLACNGPNILFDMASAMHLSTHLEIIDEVRPSLSADYLASGPRSVEIAQKWASEIAALMQTYGGNNKRLAIDRLDVPTAMALQKAGLELIDAKIIFEQARAIKSLEEVRAFKQSLQTCDDAVHAMRQQIKPGMREEQALGILLQESMARGGEYQETRLLSAGPRTNPWFQEASSRVMVEGEFVSFDTDLIGPMGYYNDFSRSWIVGEVPPNDTQKKLYDISLQQLQTNIDLLQVGRYFFDFAEQAFTLPDEYLANRYADVGHGCGLGVEYPFLWYPEDAEYGAYDGMFQENMIICIESYVGAKNGHEGVKLEQPVWLSKNGPIILSTYPLENFR